MANVIGPIDASQIAQIFQNMARDLEQNIVLDNTRIKQNRDNLLKLDIKQSIDKKCEAIVDMQNGGKGKAKKPEIDLSLYLTDVSNDPGFEGVKFYQSQGVPLREYERRIGEYERRRVEREIAYAKQREEAWEVISQEKARDKQKMQEEKVARKRASNRAKARNKRHWDQIKANMKPGREQGTTCGGNEYNQNINLKLDLDNISQNIENMDSLNKNIAELKQEQNMGESISKTRGEEQLSFDQIMKVLKNVEQNTDSVKQDMVSFDEKMARVEKNSGQQMAKVKNILKERDIMGGEIQIIEKHHPFDFGVYVKTSCLQSIREGNKDGDIINKISVFQMKFNLRLHKSNKRKNSCVMGEVRDQAQDGGTLERLHVSKLGEAATEFQSFCRYIDIIRYIDLIRVAAVDALCVEIKVVSGITADKLFSLLLLTYPGIRSLQNKSFRNNVSVTDAWAFISDTILSNVFTYPVAFASKNCHSIRQVPSKPKRVYDLVPIVIDDITELTQPKNLLLLDFLVNLPISVLQTRSEIRHVILSHSVKINSHHDKSISHLNFIDKVTDCMTSVKMHEIKLNELYNRLSYKRPKYNGTRGKQVLALGRYLNSSKVFFCSNRVKCFNNVNFDSQAKSFYGINKINKSRYFYDENSKNKDKYFYKPVQVNQSHCFSTLNKNSRNKCFSNLNNLGSDKCFYKKGEISKIECFCDSNRVRRDKQLRQSIQVVQVTFIKKLANRQTSISYSSVKLSSKHDMIENNSIVEQVKGEGGNKNVKCGERDVKKGETKFLTNIDCKNGNDKIDERFQRQSLHLYRNNDDFQNNMETKSFKNNSQFVTFKSDTCGYHNYNIDCKRQSSKVDKVNYGKVENIDVETCPSRQFNLGIDKYNCQDTKMMAVFYKEQTHKVVEYNYGRIRRKKFKYQNNKASNSKYSFTLL